MQIRRSTFWSLAAAAVAAVAMGNVCKAVIVTPGESVTPGSGSILSFMHAFPLATTSQTGQLVFPTQNDNTSQTVTLAEAVIRAPATGTLDFVYQLSVPEGNQDGEGEKPQSFIPGTYTLNVSGFTGYSTDVWVINSEDGVLDPTSATRSADGSTVSFTMDAQDKGVTSSAMMVVATNANGYDPLANDNLQVQVSTDGEDYGPEHCLWQQDACSQEQDALLSLPANFSNLYEPAHTDSPPPVPEPASLLLIPLGLAGLAIRGRRRFA